MAGTRRTQAEMDALYADGQPDNTGSPQLHRDHIASSVHSRIVTEQGFMDYNDLATTGTPLSLLAGVPMQMSNDGAGSSTNKTYKPITVTELWDEVEDELDFSELQLGDKVLMRLDVTLIVASTNTDFDMTINLGVGGTPYTLDVARESFKSTGTYKIVEVFPVYMGDTNTLINPAELYVETDKNATLTVNGWAIFVN